MHSRVYSKFARSLARFKLQPNEADKVALAISGGPDSIALAALAARWHQQDRVVTEPPLALVVDHRLRPESADEAHEAAARAAAMGLRARVLTVDWGGAVPRRHHKMRAARDARYSLLMGACAEAGAAHLMTAHHADDQAETFLLRLIHASGLDGLAGIAAVNRSYVPSHGVRLLRPLLGVHKAELVGMCNELGLGFAVDPTNEDPSFQRNRLRQLLREAATVEAAEAAEAARRRHERSSGNGAALAVFFPSNSSYVPPQIVRDVLELQRLCGKVSREQQAEARGLLQRAVLHATPATHLTPGPRAQEAMRSLRPGFEPYLPHRRLMHWPSQLAALSTAAGSAAHRHVVFQAKPFGGADEVVATAALSHVLQAVAGSAYPPSLSDCTKLAARLAGGKLVGAFTGGGCTVQPVVRSKGRYVLVVPQQDQGNVMELLRRPETAARRAARDRAVAEAVAASAEDSEGEGLMQEAIAC